MDDPLEVCGETYEHDLIVTGEQDGIRISVCRECDAELIEDLNEDAPVAPTGQG
jgi:hypothetical protein